MTSEKCFFCSTAKSRVAYYMYVNRTDPVVVCDVCHGIIAQLGFAFMNLDDLRCTTCVECRGRGGVGAGKYSGLQRCYTCDGFGKQVTRKSPLELLAEAAE